MKRKHFQTFLAIIFVSFLMLMVINHAKNGSYNWQWFRIPSLFFTQVNGQLTSGPLIKGLLVTLKITSLSFLITIIFGFTFAIFRILNNFSTKILGYLYVEIFRNTPLIIQILFFYFVIAPVFDIPAFWSAVLSISLFEGAYACEIIRAGILSIDKGQWEASYSLGMNFSKTFKYIILPQTLKNVFMPLTNIFVSLVKDSALVSVIAVYDLTMQAQKLISETFMSFEIWLTIAFIYLSINVIISFTIKVVKNNFKWGEL